MQRATPRVECEGPCNLPENEQLLSLFVRMIFEKAAIGKSRISSFEKYAVELCGVDFDAFSERAKAVTIESDYDDCDEEGDDG